MYKKKNWIQQENLYKITWFYSGSIFLQRKFSIFLRNDRDWCKVFIQN